MEKILPQLSTQLARLLFPCSLSPVTSSETAAKYICRKKRRRRRKKAQLRGLCTCLMLVTPPCVSSSLQNNFPNNHLTNRLRGCGSWTSSRASFVNSMHNLSSFKASERFRDDVRACSGGCKDLQLLRSVFNWSRGISAPRVIFCELHGTQRCNVSQEHSAHHNSQTSLQPVVTNNQLLAQQFKGSGTRCLLKLVKRAEGSRGGE